jgi:hypothetical protein
MNENVKMLPLREFMGRSEGWGRNEGRNVYQRMLEYVERNPGTIVFKVSMKDVKRIDISFASETIVELARRYRRTKGFCVTDLSDEDLIENLDAAAVKKDQPILVWRGKSARLVGMEPSEGTREAFQFALSRTEARAAEFASEKKGMSIANASMKFKQLWEQGFLLRREAAAETGGVEFIYHRIG